MSKFILEGLDRLGKSSLATNIQKRLGFHQLIHFSKPIACEPYDGILLQYQSESFKQMFKMLNEPGYNLIFDRAHLGEYVYAPLYRKYSGEYVFRMEEFYDMGHRLRADTKLILLVEDFKTSKHFVSDGDSFDDSKREQEQNLFIEAFNKSMIKNKKIVCVTEPSGGFRTFEDITSEVLE